MKVFVAFFLTRCPSQLVKVKLKSNYHLPDSQMEFERHKLERKTKDIKKEFARFFFGDLLQNMLNHKNFCDV